MKTTFCLVYQAGIANVFEEIPRKAFRDEMENGHSVVTDRIRILQSDFKSCEQFCRGLRHAKKLVRVAWCNMAGDIIGQTWHFSNFQNAPFNESFASDFVPKE